MPTSGKPADVLIVTCFHARAIFLQLLENQTTESILLALNTIFNVYGQPRYVYSDNAPNFQRAGKVYKVLNEKLKEASLHFPATEWIFSVPYRPQSNGITERMIGVSKKILAGIGFHKGTTRAQLRYMLSEAVRLINSRPLFTFNGQIITPMDMIIGHTPTALPHPLPAAVLEEINEVRVLESLRRRLSQFWSLWTEGYFLSLKDIQAYQPTNTVAVGDTVLLQDTPVQSRRNWRTGVVTQVYPGADGTVRVCDIKITATEEVVSRRSIDKIVVLEEKTLPATPADPAPGQSVTFQ